MFVKRGKNLTAKKCSSSSSNRSDTETDFETDTFEESQRHASANIIYPQRWRIMLTSNLIPVMDADIK